MLCEKCRLREAKITITKVVNGVTTTHNFCPECAGTLKLIDDAAASEWSKAIFRLLSDAVRGDLSDKDTGITDEKLKKMECPTCHKTYGEFLEDGVFGCPDCYEAFSPSVDQTILSLQGADTHTGKRAASPRRRKAVRDVTQEKLTPAQEAEFLRIRLQEAVSLEDYETAAKLRDELKRLEDKEKPHE